MLRLARLVAPAIFHHVIVRGVEKSRIVDDVVDSKNFVNLLEELASVTKTVKNVYTVKTNHGHIYLRS